MTIQFWTTLGIVCGAVLAAAGVWQKVIRPMWRTAKRAAELIDQLVGDKDKGTPSLMQQLAALNRQQNQLRDQLDAHLQWHANPGGRPARTTPPQGNGPGGRR